MLLTALVDQFVKERDIKQYSLNNIIWPSSDWTDNLKLGKEFAFIYNMSAILSVADPSDLVKGLFTVKSANLDDVMYKDMFLFSDISAGLIQVESDFISIHENKIIYKVDPDPMFTEIYSGHFKILLLKPLK